MNCLSAFRNAVYESSVICSSLGVSDPGEALVSCSGSSNRECSVERDWDWFAIALKEVIHLARLWHRITMILAVSKTGILR